jgi:hypothetical protein
MSKRRGRCIDCPGCRVERLKEGRQAVMRQTIDTRCAGSPIAAESPAQRGGTRRRRDGRPKAHPVTTGLALQQHGLSSGRISLGAFIAERANHTMRPFGGRQEPGHRSLAGF